MLARKFLYHCVCVVAAKDVEAVNKRLQARGFGPNNFRTAVGGKEDPGEGPGGGGREEPKDGPGGGAGEGPKAETGRVADIILRLDQLRDLDDLVARFPAMEVRLWPRLDKHRVPAEVRAKAEKLFDRPDCQVEKPADRKRARVGLATKPETERDLLDSLKLQRI